MVRSSLRAGQRFLEGRIRATAPISARGANGVAAGSARSRCARIRSITSGSSILAITFSRPPQRRQVSMSIANTRFRRCIHVGE